jgi:hypothetical protein
MTDTIHQGWQPIETAPRDGSSMLLCANRWITVGCWHRAQSCWASNGPAYTRYPAHEQPTHWMPAPDVPTRRQS